MKTSPDIRRLASGMDEDIVVATNQVLKAARDRGLTIRFLGGMAVKLRCPSTSYPALSRTIPDIDLITITKDSRRVSEMFVDLGLEPMKMFNALHGDKRLLFTDAKWGRQVDVFIGIFDMCHRFDFRKRLLLDDATLPLADLLVTKLQIVEINEKDYKDITALLLDHGLSETDEKEGVNAAYIAELCADDWGIWRTLTRNLEWTRSHLEEMDLQPERKDVVRGRIHALLQRIDREPKSLRWKMRSKLGERVLWYDTPERVGKITTGT
jgi:hypothetical protein